jgi:hypothetical protein
MPNASALNLKQSRKIEQKSTEIEIDRTRVKGIV